MFHFIEMGSLLDAAYSLCCVGSPPSGFVFETVARMLEEEPNHSGYVIQG